MLSILIIVLLVVLILNAAPIWPHTSTWGYGPSGIWAVVLIIFLILFLTNRIAL